MLEAAVHAQPRHAAPRRAAPRRAEQRAGTGWGVAITVTVLGLGSLVTVSPAAAVTSAIDLRNASDYGVLAASTVTNTGPSKISQHLGVSPGTAVTGFPPGVVSGTMHTADPASASAQSSLTLAYNEAAGRSPSAPAQTSDYRLGSLTFLSGVWESTVSLSIAGDLTLDARGDSTAVFVFKAGSTLTTSNLSRVILANGARAQNVFWQIGSSATLGVNSIFVGTIMAQAAITAQTGAQVQGCLLARTAAVTLDSNTISCSHEVVKTGGTVAPVPPVVPVTPVTPPATSPVPVPVPVPVPDHGEPLPPETPAAGGPGGGDAHPGNDTLGTDPGMPSGSPTTREMTLRSPAFSDVLPLALAFTGGSLSSVLWGIVALTLGFALRLLGRPRCGLTRDKEGS